MHVKHLYTDYLYFIDFRVCHYFIRDDLKTIQTPVDETEIIIYAYLEFDIKIIKLVIEEVSKYKFKKITLLLEKMSELAYYNYIPTHLRDKINLVVIDGFLSLMAYQYCNKHLIPLKWNPTSNGLFLTGKLYRYNRIELLKKLYDNNALSMLWWSFPVADTQKPYVINYYQTFYNTLPEGFDEFFNYCKDHAIIDKNLLSVPTILPDGLDQLNIDKKSPLVFLANSYPLELYQKSSFVIAAETITDDHNIWPITEKTYYAILNQRPFIMVGWHPGTLNRLKEKGYKTFNEYLPYSNYDDVIDQNERLEQIVANIQAFPKILMLHSEQIAQDIEHNYNICLNNIKKIENQFKQVCIDNRIITDSIYDEFSISWNESLWDFSNLNNNLQKEKIYLEKEKPYLEELRLSAWLNKYNQIKGADWPELANESEFNYLPDNIKQDCIEKFNFQPGNNYQEY